MIRSIATGRIVTVDSVGGGCPYLMRDDIFFRLVCNSGFEWIFDVEVCRIFARDQINAIALAVMLCM